MAERYQRLFHSDKALFSNDAPVVISASALLKDSETNSIIAQIKFQSISDKKIKGMSVNLSLFDAAGREIEEKTKYSYMDLNIARDDEFGADSAILINALETRAFKIAINEVIFEDNTIWYGANSFWQEIPPAEFLKTWLNDDELVLQYKEEIGDNSKYKPVELENLWICTCGAKNLYSEAECHSCKTNKEKLFSIDLDSLNEEKNQRIAKVKKKKRKTIAIVLIVILAIAVAIGGYILLKPSKMMSSLNHSTIKNIKVHNLEFQYPKGEDWSFKKVKDDNGNGFYIDYSEDGEYLDAALYVIHLNDVKNVKEVMKKYNMGKAEKLDLGIELPNADKVVTVRGYTSDSYPADTILAEFDGDVYEFSGIKYDEETYDIKAVEKIIKSYSEKLD